MGMRYHGVVTIPFLCALNPFLGGKEKTAKELISELYLNLFLKTLPENDESRNLHFNSLTDLCTEINVSFNNSIFANKSKQKEEKVK